MCDGANLGCAARIYVLPRDIHMCWRELSCDCAILLLSGAILSVAARIWMAPRDIDASPRDLSLDCAILMCVGANSRNDRANDYERNEML